MPIVDLTDSVIRIDGVDVTSSVSAWTLQRYGNDTPTVVLELVHGAIERDALYWNGFANIRTTAPGLDFNEVVQAIDGEELEKLMLETSDMSESAGTAALRALRELGSKLAP